MVHRRGGTYGTTVPKTTQKYRDLLRCTRSLPSSVNGRDTITLCNLLEGTSLYLHDPKILRVFVCRKEREDLSFEKLFIPYVLSVYIQVSSTGSQTQRRGTLICRVSVTRVHYESSVSKRTPVWDDRFKRRTVLSSCLSERGTLLGLPGSTRHTWVRRGAVSVIIFCQEDGSPNTHSPTRSHLHGEGSPKTPPSQEGVTHEKSNINLQNTL